MINGVFSYNNFVFNLYHFQNYKHVDNSAGIRVYYFAYMEAGHGKICAEEKTVTINEGDIFFIPMGLKYQSFWYGSPQIKIVSLGCEIIPNFKNAYYPPQVIRLTEGKSEIIELMRGIADYGPADSVLVGRFYMLLGALMPNMAYHFESKQATLIDIAEREITENPKITVRELAQKCAVSESSLYFAFKNHKGKTINQIKQSVIMQRAKELLIYTDYPIEDISSRLGFSSSSYFRKCFKAHFGTTPRDMRHSALDLS